MVQVRKILHRENYQIGIYFGFDEELKNKAKSIGARWSQTNKCWYVLYNRENYNNILSTFEDVKFIKGENNKLRPEPALIKQEIVHIAELISEIQSRVSGAEHKDLDPEFVSKIVFKGNTGKYWILKVPYKAGLTPKLMDIKGVFWNKAQQAFFCVATY